MTRNDASNGDSQDVYLELVHALEKARSRLAVAIATEMKATPLERLRYYRETEERMHRCLRELRVHRRSGDKRQDAWLGALETLRRIQAGSDHFVARQGAALQLCHRLSEALAALERLDHRISKSD